MAYELKTKQTTASVTAFLGGIEDEQKRKDCQAIRAMMKRVTGDSGALEQMIVRTVKQKRKT